MQQSERIKEISLGLRAGKRWAKVLKGDRMQGGLSNSDTEKRFLQIRFLRELADNTELHMVGPGYFEKMTSMKWVDDHWECELQREDT